MSMLRTTTKAALVAALLAAGALTAPAPSHAATVVHFDAGSVAFGYSDGYWDRAKQWHRWPSARARSEWRERNREHYYSRAHTHTNGWGWRDDHWWEH
jgi:hypothetical protein